MKRIIINEIIFADDSSWDIFVDNSKMRDVLEEGRPTMKTRVKKYGKITLFFAILTASYIIVQLNFWGDMWFGTDELDIMMLGKGIARGKLLYRELTSQHMPVSYYISALFCKLGAVTVEQQRLAFYVFFAICWSAIAFSYWEYIDKTVLICYPFIHCFVIQNIELGTQIVSEHLAGIGAVVLLLEFLTFGRKRELSIMSCIRISIAVLLTFGTIFVAIFPLFYIALGVVGKELCWRKEYKKLSNNRGWFLGLIRKYSKLFIALALPWIILFAYYAHINTFRLFIKSAYVLNREIYPKYQAGFGSNIFDALIILPFRNLGDYIVSFFNIVSTELTYVSILEGFLVAGGIVYVAKIIKEEGIVSGMVVAMFALSLQERGFFHFHSTAGIEVLAFMMTYLLVTGLKKRERDNVKSWSFGLTAIMLVYIASGYLGSINILSETDSMREQSQETEDSKIIKAITDEAEGIWTVTFANDMLMQADRIGVGGAATTPWTWEGVGKTQFAEIKKDMPRVALMRSNHEVWGYKIVDYARKVVKYIKKNYTKIPGTDWIYVRNDYYAEACEKIERLGLR